MNTLSEEIVSQLQSKIRLIIPLFGGIPVPDSVVVTWIIMFFLIGFSIIATKKFSTVPTGMQLYIETLIDFLNDFFRENIGIHWKSFAPYLGTVALYIGFSNIIGVLGLVPPTKDLNVTAALAMMSIVVVLGAGIRFRGLKGWLHHFTEPIVLVTPINVLEIFIRPLSLCMRLFGNVLGSFVIMEMIKAVAPVFVPMILSLYFDIFDGIIQTIVFVFLTTLFIKEAIE